ncbi:MAG: hypothetical protein O3A00_15455 [Planctomycetota bacterium]|nr:hypothetical protein [Planctomycetota bacterium]
MLTQDDAEFALYEARQKAIYDRQTLIDPRDRLIVELDQSSAELIHLNEKLSRERDQARLRLVEMIQFVEQKQGLPLTSSELLTELSREELDARLNQLQRQDGHDAESN